MNRCLNCGSKLIGGYCHSCGQKSTVSRYTWRSVFADFPVLYNLDFKLVRTFNNLMTRPGAFIRHYLLGKRQDFFSPFKYFFIVLALNIAVTFILNRPAIRPVIIERENARAMNHQAVSLLTNIVILIFIVPFAAGMKTTDRKSEYLFIEDYCFLLYISAQSILIFIIIQLLLAVFHPVLSGPVEGGAWFFIFSIFYLWAAIQFFGGSKRARMFKSVISYITGIFIWLILMILIGKGVQVLLS